MRLEVNHLTHLRHLGGRERAPCPAASADPLLDAREAREPHGIGYLLEGFRAVGQVKPERAIGIDHAAAEKDRSRRTQPSEHAKQAVVTSITVVERDDERLA